MKIRKISLAMRGRQRIFNDRKMLLLEQDYELASIFDAMQLGNEEDILHSKKRLMEIQEELKAIEIMLEPAQPFKEMTTYEN